MAKLATIEGCLTALVTPLRDGKVDFDGLAKLGIRVSGTNNYLFSRRKLRGARILLDEASVTATENIVMAAVRDTDRDAGPENRVGLKIRCGGLEASAIPEVEAVAVSQRGESGKGRATHLKR